MFRVFLSAAVTFVAAAILVWIWGEAMQPLINTIDSFAVEQSQHAEWFAATVEWMPLVILLSLITLVVAAAVAHRGATGV